MKCKWCKLAQQLGGYLCRPCWRKMYKNKQKGK